MEISRGMHGISLELIRTFQPDGVRAKKLLAKAADAHVRGEAWARFAPSSALGKAEPPTWTVENKQETSNTFENHDLSLVADVIPCKRRYGSAL